MDTLSSNIVDTLIFWGKVIAVGGATLYVVVVALLSHWNAKTPTLR